MPAEGPKKPALAARLRVCGARHALAANELRLLHQTGSLLVGGLVAADGCANKRRLLHQTSS